MRDLRLERVKTLDPLRGIAALGVTWFHFTQGGPLLEDGWLKATGTFGWVGVQSFFVISGFVLPLSLWRGNYRLRRHFPTFMVKRVVRIDPPYLVTICLTILLAFLSASIPGFAGESPSFRWGQILGHVAYLNAFTGEPWLSPVFWTLAVEFQFYLLLALLYPLLAAVPTGWWQALIVTGGALLGPTWSNPAHVIHHLPFFALGLATFYRYQGLGLIPFLFGIATAGVIAGLDVGIPHAIAGVSTALVIAFLRPRTIPRPLVFLGTISYSLYLLHVPIGGRVINLGARWANTSSEQLIILAAAVAVSILVSYGLYRLVERPSQSWSTAIGYGQVAASSAFASAGKHIRASWAAWRGTREG